MVPMFLVHKVMVPHGGSFTQSKSIPHDTIDSGQSPPNGVTYSTRILHYS